ncbi:hypothetical protein DL98DRAFT_584618 [Cadophora sp. DSE1049]|nr:hypothetical protein DL98DRAFT_584618 [Cadophora sp. DSE1049]
MSGDESNHGHVCEMMTCVTYESSLFTISTRKMKLTLGSGSSKDMTKCSGMWHNGWSKRAKGKLSKKSSLTMTMRTMNVLRKAYQQLQSMTAHTWEYSGRLSFLITAYEHFAIDKDLRSSRRDHTHGSQPAAQGKTLKITIIRLGIFGIEEESMPAVVSDSRHYLVSNPLDFNAVRPRETKEKVAEGTQMSRAPTVDIPHVIWLIRCKSRRPNMHDGYPVPPLMFLFFVYILRKHFNLRFCSNMLDRYTGCTYDWEIESGTAFFLPVLTDFVEFYHLPVLSYRW